MSSEQKPGNIQITNVPVKLRSYDQPAHYANHISVNSSGANVQIEFSQILSPGVESDGHFRQLATDGLSGHLLCRLLVPDEVFRSFILGIAEQIAEGEED